MKKQLIWLTDSPGWGGSEVNLLRAISFLPDFGHLVGHGPSIAGELDQGLTLLGAKQTILEVGNTTKLVIPVLADAIKLAINRDNRPVIIWCHHSDSYRWGSCLLAGLRIRYAIVEQLIPVSHQSFLKSRLSIPIKRWTSSAAETVVLNAHSQVEPYRKIFGIAGRNLRVIANSRPVQSIAKSVEILRRDRSGLRRSLNLDEKPVLLCLARLTGQKDQIGLLKACESVVTPITVVLVGEGPDRAELEMLSRNLTKLSVIFAGHQSDPLPWLAAADLFVLPSLTEGLPGALIEALAAGLPCITTDIPGNRELVIDGVTGLTVPTKAPERLAIAINRLIDSPALALRLALAGFEHAAAHYDEASEKAAWQELAAELVGTETGARPKFRGSR